MKMTRSVVSGGSALLVALSFAALRAHADPVIPVALPAYELDVTASEWESRNFFEHNASLTPQQKATHNQALKAALAAPIKTHFPLTSASGVARRDALSKDEAKQLLSRLLEHPVAGPKATWERDKTHSVGFCFGRAYYVHIQALREFRLNADMIRKIWVVGTLRGSNITWGHHVATIVRAKEGGWWVIDSFTGLVTAEEWIKKLSTGLNAKDKDATFYVTSAKRFSPFSDRAYTKVDLDDPAGYYLDFFNDLREYERKHLGKYFKPLSAPASRHFQATMESKLFTKLDLSSANEGTAAREKLRKSMEAIIAQAFKESGVAVDVTEIHWFGPEKASVEFELVFKSAQTGAAVKAGLTKAGAAGFELKAQ